MKALVDAAGIQLGEACFRFCRHRYRHLIVGLSLHDLMMQDELMLVFQDADHDAQLDRDAGLALADPFGVRLKHREHLILVRNGFAKHHGSPGLFDLTLGVTHEAVDPGLRRLVSFPRAARL
jgi:hypothetical protein